MIGKNAAIRLLNTIAGAAQITVSAAGGVGSALTIGQQFMSSLSSDFDRAMNKLYPQPEGGSTQKTEQNQSLTTDGFTRSPKEYIGSTQPSIAQLTTKYLK